MKISFRSYANNTNFHMKSFAPSLAFIMRLTASHHSKHNRGNLLTLIPLQFSEDTKEVLNSIQKDNGRVKQNDTCIKTVFKIQQQSSSNFKLPLIFLLVWPVQN